MVILAPGGTRISESTKELKVCFFPSRGSDELCNGTLKGRPKKEAGKKRAGMSQQVAKR